MVCEWEKLSGMTLGTVQLGMDYGLYGQTEKPAKEYAFSVLDSAVENGINILDTANNYGTSENVIGEWLEKRSKETRPFVVTKIGPFDHSDEKALRGDIHRQTMGCLTALGLPSLDILMAHDV